MCWPSSPRSPRARAGAADGNGGFPGADSTFAGLAPGFPGDRDGQGSAVEAAAQPGQPLLSSPRKRESRDTARTRGRHAPDCRALRPPPWMRAFAGMITFAATVDRSASHRIESVKVSPRLAAPESTGRGRCGSQRRASKPENREWRSTGEGVTAPSSRTPAVRLDGDELQAFPFFSQAHPMSRAKHPETKPVVSPTPAGAD